MREDLSGQSLLAIAEGVAAELGNAYLSALVRSLREGMDVSLAFLTSPVGTPPARLRAYAAWEGGSEAETFEYEIAGSPCRRVYSGDTVIIPCDVATAFPVEAGFEGYAGVPLWASKGKVAGHLAVLSRSPMTDPDLVRTVLRIYGMRAEAEVQRAELEQERSELIARLERSNQRLDRQLSAARQANGTKTQLLALAAHDMRGGLQTILLRAEMIGTYLDKGGEDKRIRDSAERSIEAVERLTHLIDGIIDRAKQDAESLPLVVAQIQLGEVVRRAVGYNADHAARKSIHLMVADNIEAEIEADEDLLTQALDNYISNAIKYSPPGKAVRVFAGKKAGSIHLVVEDEGQGLSGFDIERAFGRFATLSARPTGGETATGLGLSLVRAIAEAHGGSAWVRSDGKGKGSRFGITLPMASPRRER